MPTDKRLEKIERELAELRTELAECVRTRTVQVVDNAGMTRAVLKVTADGPSLELLDEAGHYRAGLSALVGGSGLGLFDAAGKGRIRMGVPADGPRLELLDAACKTVWRAP